MQKRNEKEGEDERNVCVVAGWKTSCGWGQRIFSWGCAVRVNPDLYFRLKSRFDAITTGSLHWTGLLRSTWVMGATSISQHVCLSLFSSESMH